MACESSKFEIFYIPIEREYYVPPSREDIMKYGTHFEIKSCLLNDLFKNLYNQNGMVSNADDLAMIRIMIVNKYDNTEIFIATDKILISLTKNIKYNIHTEIINNVLKELIDFVKREPIDNR
jgi:hypothetical protein